MPEFYYIVFWIEIHIKLVICVADCKKIWKNLFKRDLSYFTLKLTFFKNFKQIWESLKSMDIVNQSQY